MPTKLTQQAIDTLDSQTPNRLYGISWNDDGQLTSLTTIGKATSSEPMKAFTTTHDKALLYELVDVCLEQVEQGTMVLQFDTTALPGTPLIVNSEGGAILYKRKPLFIANSVEQAVSHLLDYANNPANEIGCVLRYKRRQGKWQVCEGSYVSDANTITESFMKANPNHRAYNLATKSHFWFGTVPYVADERD